MSKRDIEGNPVRIIKKPIRGGVRNQAVVDAGGGTRTSPSVLTLSDDLWRLFESGVVADVVFDLDFAGSEADGFGARGVVRAHKSVLAARSDHFAEMFMNDSVGLTRIRVPGVGSEAFHHVMRFVYSDVLPDASISASDAAEVLAVASEFRLSRLKDAASSILSAVMTDDASCDCVLLALRHNSSALLDVAVARIQGGLARVRETAGWRRMVTQDPEIVAAVVEAFAKTADVGGR